MPRQPRPPDATPGSPGSRAGLTIIGEYRNAASVPPARPPQHPAAPAAEGTQRLTSNPTGAPRPHKAHRTGPRASTAGRSSRSPTTPQRPGRSTSGLDDAPVVVETTTGRGPLESIRQLVRIGSESRVPAQQREPDPTQPRMNRQRRRRPGRPRPFPPPGPPITSPSERSPRRAHGCSRFSSACARAKPPYGRCTDVLSTPDLGVRYTYKAGTLHVLTSRKAAIFPVFQALQTRTSALRRAHAAPAAPRHFGPVSAAAAQRHGAPIAGRAQRQPRQRPLVRPRGLEQTLLARELARRDVGAVPPIQPAHRRRDLAWRPAIPPRRLAHLRLDLAPGRERRRPGRAVQRRARPRPRPHSNRRVVEPGADPRHRLTPQLADQRRPQHRPQSRQRPVLGAAAARWNRAHADIRRARAQPRPNDRRGRRLTPLAGRRTSGASRLRRRRLSGYA